MLSREAETSLKINISLIIIDELNVFLQKKFNVILFK